MVSVPPASIEAAGGFLIVAEIPSLHWRQALFNITESQTLSNYHLFLLVQHISSESVGQEASE